MFVTEEEAKTKWCPYVRHGAPEIGTFNRGVVCPINDHPDNGGMLCNCIASACMAWRWQVDVAYRAYDAGPPPGKGWVKTGHTIHDGETVEWEISTGKGRCGLAGVA